ncbi:MAG: PAS domain S-box protein, partial [Phycisphaeraceae bacterium]
RAERFCEIRVYPMGRESLVFLSTPAPAQQHAWTPPREDDEATQRAARQQRLFETAHIGMWEWDTLTGRVWWSANMASIHGVEPDAFDETFESCLANVHPEDRPEVLEAIRVARQRQGEFHITYRQRPGDGTARWLESRGQVIPDALGRPRWLIGICQEVTRRKQAESRLRGLAEAGAILGQSLAYLTTLSNVAELMVPDWADWCAVDLVNAQGEIETVAVAHADSQKAELARRMRREYPPRPDHAEGAAHVIQTGEPVCHTELTDQTLQRLAQDERHLQMLRSLGLHSALIVPLKARGRTLGALTLVMAETPHRFTHADLPYVQELAYRCALAVDNVRLYKQAQRELAQREQTEQALRESELWFRQAIECMAVGVYATDAEGRIVRYNRRIVELWGRAPETGEQAEKYCGSLALYRPDGTFLPHAACPMARTLQTGEPVHGEEIIIERPDGSRAVALASPSPIRDESGRMIGAINCILDITDRKGAERALARERELLERIIEHIPVLLVMWEPALHRFTLNRHAQEVLGWTTEDANDGDFMGLVYPDPAYRAQVAQFMRSLDGGWREWIATTKDGRHVPVDWANIRLADETMIGIGVDLRERKEQEQRLRRFNQELEQRVAERTAEAEQRAAQLRALTSELAQAEQRERRRLAQVLHDDLQQLLVGVKMQAGLLDQADEAARPRYVEQIRELIDEAVQSARSLSHELSPQVLYEKGLAAALHWLAEQKCEKLNLTVHVDADERADPGNEDVRVLLFDAVRELLLNVTKHAGTTEAWVRLHPDACGGIELTVTDEGSGFDPRANGQRTKGAGLGLFGMQERLALFGGELTVESQPNTGTRVTMRVPRHSASPADDDAARHVKGRARRRLLLVDDHAVVRESLAHMLREQGSCEVVGEASDGEQALTLVASTEPDVVLLDVMMPGLNGIETARRLRERWPDMRIIGLTMHVEADIVQTMCEAGAETVLSKGEPIDRLIDQLETVGA